MKFSNMVTHKGKDFFVVKTGRKNIRILEPGQPYDKSFVVPLKKVSNRRPADGIVDDDDDDETPEGLTDLSELTDPNDQIDNLDTQEEPDEEFQPQ